MPTDDKKERESDLNDLQIGKPLDSAAGCGSVGIETRYLMDAMNEWKRQPDDAARGFGISSDETGKKKKKMNKQIDTSLTNVCGMALFSNSIKILKPF